MLFFLPFLDYFQDYCVALRNKKSLIGQVRIIVVAYFGVVRLATCFVYVLSPWYYNWFQSGVDYAGNAAICLCLIYVLFPKKDTYFNNVDDFQRFTQIQNLIDRQIEDNNGRVAEQMNVIPWDLSKIVFVFWPTQNENQTSGDHDSILLDSEESKNIKRDDKNERGTTLSASIGYEELFYLNEASKANEKLI